MKTIQTINLYGVANGVGISRDMEIIRDVLVSAGYSVELNHPFRFRPTKLYDLNIFLERFRPELFAYGKKNVMIPNQEWFEPSWLPALKEIDYIFTKTKFATDVFNKLDCKTEYISFTSYDRYLPNINKYDSNWLHVAGKSVQKQTDIVIRTWENNPGFPQLTLVQDVKFYRARNTSRNINMCHARLPDEVLLAMQNACAVHVCPSETEGFGHYINEAMSCKNVVITTNATPMTELVTPERGFFVESVHQEQMRLSIKNVINEETLSKAVVQVMITEDLKKRQMGEQARQFYLENDAFFRRRLVEAVQTVLS